MSELRNFGSKAQMSAAVCQFFVLRADSFAYTIMMRFVSDVDVSKIRRDAAGFILVLHEFYTVMVSDVQRQHSILIDHNNSKQPRLAWSATWTRIRISRGRSKVKRVCLEFCCQQIPHSDSQRVEIQDDVVARLDQTSKEELRSHRLLLNGC